MKRLIIDLPVVYRNTGYAPRSRWQAEYLAVGRAAIEIPAVDPADADPALVYRHYYGSGQVLCLPFMNYRGALVRQLAAPSLIGSYGRRLDASGLALLDGAPLSDIPEALRPHSTSKCYGNVGPVHPRETLNPKRVVTDGFAAAVEELQRQVEANVVMIGDKPFARCPDPCWSFSKRRDRWFSDILLEPDGDFTLPADRTDLAGEFVIWARERHGIEFHPPLHREIEALSTLVPHSHNPIVRNAAALAREVFKHRPGPGYDFDLVAAASAASRKDAGVAEALAFAAAVEKMAGDPAVADITFHMSNALWVEMFWKAYELLPEGYKVDPADEELLAPPSP